MQREAPGVRLKIHEGFSDQIERLRVTGDVDVGVYSKFHAGDVTDDRALFVSTMVLAAPRSMPELPAEIDFADLARYPLVMPGAPNGLRTTFEAVARRLQVTLNVLIDTASAAAQNEICEHCGCYMIKAQEALSDENVKGRFTASLIVNPRIQREIVLATTQQRPLSRAARQVADGVSAILGRLPRREQRAGTG